MSEVKVSQKGNTIVFSGELTNDFNQMKRECAGRFETMFGDAKNLIVKLKEDGYTALTEQQILDLLTQGTTEEVYETHNIWGYFCVEPETFKNYMFSENKRWQKEPTKEFFQYLVI